MTKEKQRIKIAEACGWNYVENEHLDGPLQGWGWSKDGLNFVHNEGLPDYLNDLNAMHDADSIFESSGKHCEYISHIKAIILREAGLHTDGHCGDWRVFKSTAAQRAEAFLKTLKLLE